MEYITQQAAVNGALSSIFNELGALYTKKLWHQMGEALVKILSNEWFTSSARLLSLYHEFVSKFKSDIAPLILVKFVIKASKQEKDIKVQLSFLESIIPVVESDIESLLLARLEISMLYLPANNLASCKNSLSEIQLLIDSNAQEMTRAISSRFYQVKMEYHKIAGTASQFFRAALLYLSYTPVTDIPTNVQVSLSTDLALAALAAEDQYNFGEILQHAIFKSLQDSPNKWIYDLLIAFDQGKISEFEAIFKAQSGKQEVLSRNAAFLRQKIRIMNLMEMVFTRPNNSRNVLFTEIMATCQIKQDEVELLLMKCMSLAVIKGVIDQVDQCVRIKWVQPRVLNIKQIEGLRDRLVTWADKVKESADFLESNAPELMISSF